ncbi:MAG TPA: multidrug efflux RND transporter permease subunit [Oleiagrimonas sp.]|nr:multidrug efflux RND transporter permease subunit [Oleiagrimonas sp.]
MPKFFIDRPVFAWVVAILISLGGVISILNLGVESYPSIAPVQVNVSASYPGASAETLEKTVTQVIEQQLTGIDNLLYFSSSSSSTGRVQINLTFAAGTDADIAQVQVQNKVSLAAPRLPKEVTQQGVTVQKASAGFLMLVALRSEDGTMDQKAINDYVAVHIIDQISRLPGVGNVNQFGSGYAMRIWLNPDKLHGYGLSATQVLNAVQSQNVQFAAGSIGAMPSPDSQGFTANVTTESRFNTPEQFGNIILRANADGTTVRLKDVAKIGFGAQHYGFNSTYNGAPTGAFAIQLQSGANALTVAEEVKNKMNELSSSFPAGLSWLVPYDSTTFVNIAIEEVIMTLAEAIVLVFLVMLLFLQNIRATIIPTLVIPVALLGTFLGMTAMGFTINQLTMFGMVLAIGILVDDAIVVIENVERVMREDKLPIKQATRKAMGQITGAVVAITVVLAAVFIPSALQGGSVGAIYQQFALTIALSMVFSAFLALSFTPALCVQLIKHDHDKKKNIVFRKFNQFFDWTTNNYAHRVHKAAGHAPRWMIAFVLLAVLCGFLFVKMPTSFLPEEDQGYAMIIVQLPPGATLHRTEDVMAKIRKILDKDPATANVFQVSGFSFVGSGENVGMAFVQLKDWDERSVTAQQYIARNNGKLFMGIHDATVFMLNVPTVQGLGQFGGFAMYLEDRSGKGFAALTKAEHTLLAAARKNPVLTQVRPNALPDAPQLKLNVDRTQAQSMGLSVTDVYNAVRLMLAPVYINDFSAEGRTKRVIMQAQAPYRMGPEALTHFYTPSSLIADPDHDGSNMVPISNVVHPEWEVAPPDRTRYNGYSAIQINGSAAEGYSSGQAMAAMQKIVNEDLPEGFAIDWTGQSYQEVMSGNTAPLLFGLSLIVAFLCLAALYESWSIPISVLLIVPLGVLGSVAFTMLRGLPNDIYFKIGLITIIGLAAKNAILIIEYAVAEQAAGRSLREAVVEAARLRFRPILMTSLAFILGVLPLAISTGAGANARHAIGTGVIGGMLFATVLGVLFVPVFYVVIRRLLGDKLDTHAGAIEAQPFESEGDEGTPMGRSDRTP